MKFAAVIFDNDGVLVDSEPLENRVLASLLADIGLDLTPEETFNAFIGLSLDAMLDAIARMRGAAVPPDFVARLESASFEAFARELRPVEGVAAVLDALTCPVAVASNGTAAKLEATLRAVGFADRFRDRAFSFEAVARPKPAPDLYLHAAAALGVAPARCAVVEDTPTGVRAARAAGMTVFGYGATLGTAVLVEAGARGFERMTDLLPMLAGD